jgi:hypothetical protein
VRGWQLGKPRRTLARLDAWSRSGLRSPCVEVAREGTCRFRKVYPFSTWHSPGPERIVDHSQNQARVRVPGTAAQTRMVSVAGTRLEPRKSARPFKSPPQPGTSFLGRCVSCFTLGPADSLVSWRGHRAIGDGDCPFGRFLPTWPRWLPLAGPLSQWSSLHRHLAGGGAAFAMYRSDEIIFPTVQTASCRHRRLFSERRNEMPAPGLFWQTERKRLLPQSRNLEV